MENHKDKGRDICYKINKVLNSNIFKLQYVGIEKDKFLFDFEIRGKGLPKHSHLTVPESYFDFEGLLAVCFQDIEHFANTL